jgi:hypothetical protein
MTKQIFILLFTYLATLSATAQSKWPILRVYGGVALGAEDRRLFDYKFQDGLLDEPHKLDRTFSVGVQAEVVSRRRIALSAGIGYTAQNTRFFRPYDASIFPPHEFILGFNTSRYTISQLSLPITGVVYLDRQRHWGIQTNVVTNFGFKRRFNHDHKAWDFSFKSLEIYPGLTYRINHRISVEASYRAYYLNQLDKYTICIALFPNNGNVPEKYRGGYERYNPNTMMFRVLYRLN